MRHPKHLRPSRLRPAFDQSTLDWGYLELVRELSDQVHEVDFFNTSLMRYPTKDTATCLLHSRIDIWFDGLECGDLDDPMIADIAERHFIEPRDTPND